MNEKIESSVENSRMSLKIPTFEEMTIREWEFIRKRAGLSYRAIGEAAFNSGGRDKPFHRSTVADWTIGHRKEIMKMLRVELLYLSMRHEQFEQLRKDYQNKYQNND